MLFLAHQVNRLLAQRAHTLHELGHQHLGITLALMRRVDHHRHDHHIRRFGRMPHQLLERLVRHHHLMGAARVDKPDHLAVRFQDQKTLGILRDARGDLFQGGGFVAFVGDGFDFKAARGVGGQTVAQGGGGHGRFLGH